MDARDPGFSLCDAWNTVGKESWRERDRRKRRVVGRRDGSRERKGEEKTVRSGSTERTHRRGSLDVVDRPAWYSVLVRRHNWPPTDDAPPGIAKTRNYSLINCQRSM